MTEGTRYLTISVAIAIGVLGGSVQAGAQTKEARGTVTAVAQRSMTVRAGDQELTFFADHETHLGVRRAEKALQRAKAGSPPPSVSDYFAAGDVVLVRYREDSGRHHALDIGRVSGTGDGGGSISEPERTARGTVKSLTASELVLDENGRDSVFAITSDTDVMKKGATKETKAAGGSTSITTFVHAGDTVIVNYHDIAGRATAAQVRVQTSNR